MSEDDRDALGERARQLARPRDTRGRRESIRSAALFERSGVAYAIETAYVLQVTRVLAPTPLPLTERCWRGLTSLHGELLGIVDLPLLLDEEVRPSVRSDSERDGNGERKLETMLVMVIGRERAEFGLIIDALLEARTLGDDVAPLAGREHGGLVRGATADGVRVVRADALLADPRLTIPLQQPSAT